MKIHGLPNQADVSSARSIGATANERQAGAYFQGSYLIKK